MLHSPGHEHGAGGVWSNMKSRVAAIAAALLLSAAVPAQDLRESRKTFLRARAAIAEGSYREALDLYRKVIEVLPGDAVVRFEYAQLLRDLNVPEEAFKQAQEVVRLDPKLVEGHRLLGGLELAAAERDPSRLAKAIEELEAARKLAPGDPAIAAPLARALLAKGRAAEAAAVLEEAGEARAQPALARISAEAKAKSGRTKEAQEIYRTLLEQTRRTARAPRRSSTCTRTTTSSTRRSRFSQTWRSSTPRTRPLPSALPSISRGPAGSRRRRSGLATSPRRGRRTGRSAGFSPRCSSRRGARPRERRSSVRCSSRIRTTTRREGR
jgi:tetratricopeptide (TPR) repeat protein